MDPVTVNVLSLVSNWLFKIPGLRGLRKPRVLLESKNVRFKGNTRIPEADGIPAIGGGFYEVIELTLTNKSARKVLITEINISAYVGAEGEHELIHAYPLGERNIELDAGGFKTIRVEPWYWLAQLIAHFKFSEALESDLPLSVIWQAFRDRPLSFKISTSHSEKIVVKNLTPIFSFDADRLSFFSKNPDDPLVDLGSIVLRDYRAMKIGLLEDYHGLEKIEEGAEDKESQKFLSAVMSALKKDPHLKETIMANSHFDVDDPFSEFNDLSANDFAPHASMAAYGGDWVQIRLLKDHLKNEVQSEIWSDDNATHYFLLSLRNYITMNSIVDSSSIHPDFLLSATATLERFGIYEYGSIRTNMPFSVLQQLTGQLKSESELED